MAIVNFIPEVWNAKLLVGLETSHVYGAADVINRDYEGDISQYGDTVHITNLVDPTIGNYTAHTDITIEDVDDADTVLTINQSKYFAFEVDDIEKRQARGDVMNEQARKAAYKLKDISDKYLAGLMATGVAAGNLIAEQTISEGTNKAYNILVGLRVKLDKSDVPSDGRWVVVTPDFHGLLLQDSRFIAAGDAQGADVRTNGHVGRAAGFNIKVSNNAPDGPGAGAGKLIIAGYKGATSFAEQIAKTEATRKEKGFADIVKGLHLYGAKVIRSTGLAAADVIVS
ncbi:phage major capsid protein [Arthrobacter sp. UYCu723]